MAVGPDWIAVDWGSSNLRAWAMDSGGSMLDERRSDRGMAGLTRPGFEGALLELVEDWLGPRDAGAPCPVIACGMVGARQGWVEAPYTAVPAEPLGAAPVAAETRDPRLKVHVIPGLKQASPADVMRGEETQIAGFLHLNPKFDGVICLPGTHTKWAQVSAGEVVSFRSAMTGELFQLLTRQSVLRHSTEGGAWDEEAFSGALDEAMSRPEALAVRLFGLRASALIEGLAPGAARARLSGLLIGCELAALRPYWLGQQVALVGAPALSALYETALNRQGLRPILTRGDAMTRAGLNAARVRMTEGAA